MSSMGAKVRDEKRIRVNEGCKRGTRAKVHNACGHGGGCKNKVMKA